MLPIMSSTKNCMIWSLLNDISWTTGPNSNDFTELFLVIPSTEIAQIVPLKLTKGLPEL